MNNFRNNFLKYFSVTKRSVLVFSLSTTHLRLLPTSVLVHNSIFEVFKISCGIGEFINKADVNFQGILYLCILQRQFFAINVWWFDIKHFGRNCRSYLSMDVFSKRSQMSRTWETCSSKTRNSLLRAVTSTAFVCVELDS